MKFNFDQTINRRGTDCVKWDVADRAFKGENLLPMWIADMNFPVVPTVQEAIIERVNHPEYGYFITPDEYYNSIIEWHEKRNVR